MEYPCSCACISPDISAVRGPINADLAFVSTRRKYLTKVEYLELVLTMSLLPHACMVYHEESINLLILALKLFVKLYLKSEIGDLSFLLPIRVAKILLQDFHWKDFFLKIEIYKIYQN